MGERTQIAWCDHTFNPWRGCSKVSPGCANCYAERQAKRNPAVLGEWGPDGQRALASEAYWRQPVRWNTAAEAAGERRRVFCGSLMDVFEDNWFLDESRDQLIELMAHTPWLDWLLLTKRPEWASCRFSGLADPRYWLGVSVEDQERADERIPILLDTPAAVRFLSCEPLLGPVDLRLDSGRETGGPAGWVADPRPDWVILGCESGPNRRRCELGWVEAIVDQCRRADVPVYVKQLDMAGELVHDVDRFPADLQARQFPPASVASPPDL